VRSGMRVRSVAVRVTETGSARRGTCNFRMRSHDESDRRMNTTLTRGKRCAMTFHAQRERE